MISYSKGERSVMNATFQKLFVVDADVLSQQAIQDWLCEAPITVVEYDGSLPKENRKMRDQRMEIFDVYDGSIHTLVEYLRRLYPEKKKSSKWELIFSACNEISSAQKAIEQAIAQRAFGQKDVVEEMPQVVEEQLTSQGSSSEVNEEQVQSSQISTEEKSDNAEVVNPVKVDEGIVEEKTVEEPIVPIVEEINNTSMTKESAIPSGNVTKQEENSLLNKNKNNNENMEDKNMANVTDLLDAAKMAGGQADPAAEAQVPGVQGEGAVKSNASATKAVDEKTKVAVVSILEGSQEQRNRWTIENAVTAIICPKKPAALRAIGKEGTVTKETDATKAGEEITSKLVAFITAVSGKENITIDEFAALPAEQKYANVVNKGDNLAKAEAMYNKLLIIKQNPLAKYDAFIPSADKCSYPIKGFCIGSEVFSTDEFIVQVVEKSNGAVYAEGYVNNEGKSVGEKPVVFKLKLATKKEKAKATGISREQKATRVPIIRPMNKAAFLADPSHIQYLFTKEAENEQGKGTFKAELDINGTKMGASVSVYKIEGGNRVKADSYTDENPVYKTKVVSINVSVPVAKIENEFEARFQGKEGESRVITGNRWGIQISSTVQNDDFGNVTDMASTPLMAVLAGIYEGGVKFGDTVAASNLVNTIKSAANKQAEADANAAADDLE